MASVQEIHDVFRRTLGREARADEFDFFRKFIDEGDLSLLEVGQVLEGSPEAQQTRQRGQRQEYADFLAGSDKQVLGQAGDELTSRFRQMGRTPSSSGYVAAFADTARQLAMARQAQLAPFVAGGLQDLQGAYAAGGAGAQARGFGQRDLKQQRAWGIEDYYREKSDYDNYLNQQQRLNRQRTMAQFGGAAIGAGVGGFLGGVPGARAGAGGGGSGGGIFG